MGFVVGGWWGGCLGFVFIYLVYLLLTEVGFVLVLVGFRCVGLGFGFWFWVWGYWFVWLVVCLGWVWGVLLVILVVCDWSFCGLLH